MLIRRATARRLEMVSEQVTESAVWKLAKFDDPDGEVERFTRSGHTYQEAMEKFPEKFLGLSSIPVPPETHGNLLLNAGITVLLNLLIGAGGQTSFANANARLGIGDSSTAASATQTGLQAATNHYWQLADATFPSVSSQTVTCQCTVGGTAANFAWNEFVMDNDGTAGSTTTAPTYSSTVVALNRVVSAQGTKTSGQSWVLSLAITFS
jgi:hypothetical protein